MLCWPIPGAGSLSGGLLSIRQLLLILFFSHHAPEQIDHCLQIPLPGGRSFPLCARCLSIWPLTLVLLLLQIVHRVDLSSLDPWGLLLLPLPTVIEFMGEQLGRIEGDNVTRMLVGVPLGLSMSRMLFRYFLHPADPLFWAIVAVYGGGCGLTAAFVLRRRLQGPANAAESPKTGL